MTPSHGPKVHIRQPRLAEVVADVLRRQILSGQMSDGHLLPKQEDLIEEFNVSKPTIREALRILETERLVTVQRGNVGGAIVHVPQVANAAYMLGLVLQSRGVHLRDVGEALENIEPVCASLCAQRDDRLTTVVPRLRQVHDDALTCPRSDQVRFTQLARQFHEELVAGCGNETLIQMVGALETLWSAHQQEWTVRNLDERAFAESEFSDSSLALHGRIIELIEAGDADGVARAARDHLSSSVFYAVSNDQPSIVRAAELR